MPCIVCRWLPYPEVNFSLVFRPLKKMTNIHKFLAALFVFCLWLGGTAEAALPAPPSIPDYQDGGKAEPGQATAPQMPLETASKQDKGEVTPDASLSAPPQNPVAASLAANQDIPATVANFLSNPASADEAMRLFRAGDSRENKTDKDYEALHRLLWYARQLGSVDAAFTYGRLFDPLEPQWWTVKKDAERALAFYQSVALQNQDALAAMNRLRDWMASGKPAR